MGACAQRNISLTFPQAQRAFPGAHHRTHEGNLLLRKKQYRTGSDLKQPVFNCRLLRAWKNRQPAARLSTRAARTMPYWWMFPAYKQLLSSLKSSTCGGARKPRVWTFLRGLEGALQNSTIAFSGN